MSKYKVVIEAPGLVETVEFEADNDEEAEEIGRVEFFEVCNYGVSQVEDE